MKNLLFYLLLLFTSTFYVNAQVKYVTVSNSDKSISQNFSLKVKPINNLHSLEVGLNNDTAFVINEIGLSSFSYATFENIINNCFKTSTKTELKNQSNLNFEPPLTEWYTYLINKITTQPLNNTIDSLSASISEPAGYLYLKPNFKIDKNEYTSKYASVEIDDDMMKISYHYYLDKTENVVNTSTFLVPLKRSDEWNKFTFKDKGISVADFLSYEPDSIARIKTYHVEYFNKVLYPNNTANHVGLTQKNIYDYLNVTGFVNFYDLLNTESKTNSTANALIELNLTVPFTFHTQNKSLRWLSNINLNTNVSPLGKYTPYFVFNTSNQVDSNYIKNVKFEIFRNHFTNTSLNFGLLEKNWGNFTFFSLHAGLHYFNSKIRENNLYKSVNNNYDSTVTFTDFTKADIVHFIGPELKLLFKHKVSKVCGYDISMTYNYLVMKNQRFELMSKYATIYKDMKLNDIDKHRNLNLIIFDANFYLRPFSKQMSNRSGFTLRTRIFEDLDSNLPPTFQFMIGYSLSLEDVVKY